MALIKVTSPTLTHINPKEASPISAAISACCLLNKNSKTAADHPKSPWAYLSETNESTAANVLLTSVPTGATALDLFHEFNGALPVVLPKVRVFGEVPYTKHPGHPLIAAPSSVLHGANIGTTANMLNDWIPLPDTAGNYAITIGSATETEPMHNDAPDTASTGAAAGGIARSTTATLYLRGCVRVIVLIDTAATTIPTGQIAGNFCY